MAMPYSGQVRCIYCIAAPFARAIKIGWSIAPLDRLVSLQAGSPIRLKLLAYAKGTFDSEQSIHRRMRRYRIRGEWFAVTEETKLFVEEAVGDPAEDVFLDRQLFDRLKIHWKYQNQQA